ncbi:MAG: acyltransferase family protein [Firmicutes bacterium]|nr:acyltransferase family protein [Bacillota bacterium]
MEKLRKTGNVFYDRTATADEKGRLYYLDNAKFILIFLVVLAHSISSLRETPFVNTVWAVINYFHMPALIFISGFLAKRYIAKSREIKVQRVATYVILYLAAQVCLYLYQTFALGADVPADVLAARPALWFLQCLIAWYVLLPVLDYFKPGYVMAAGILFGLFVGYENGAAHFLSISRVVVHLPFFMAGYYIKQEHIDKLRSWKFRAAGGGVFAAVAAVSAVFPWTVLGNLMTCNTPYAKIGALVKYVPRGLQWTSRLWFYGVAAALIVSFLALVPRGKAIFTKLGQETLSVYILHIFLYLANRQFKWYLLFDSPGGIALLILIALALTVVFSLKPFTLPFHWLQKIQVRLKKSAEG